MKKLFYFLIVPIFILIFLVVPTLAITQTAGEMTINHDGQLFPSSEVWYPGQNLRNIIIVKNNGSLIRVLGINSTNTSHTERLADGLIFKVDVGGQYIFGGNSDKTMKDFWNEGVLEVTNLRPSETKTIGFTISMPGLVDNKYQGKEAKFDLIIGFLNQSSVILPVSGGGDNTTTGIINKSMDAILGVTKNTFSGFFSSPKEVLGDSTSVSKLKPTSLQMIANIDQIKGLIIKNSNKIIISLILLILFIFSIYTFIKKIISKNFSGR